MRTVLSLRGMGAPRNGHIVCEVCDVDNEDLVKLVGKDSVETVVSHDVIGRLMIQCARERGLAPVLDKLLGFEDNEFYINDCAQWPELFGRRFDELMFSFEHAVVVGFLRRPEGGDRGEGGEGPAFGKVELNPANESVLRPGDGIIVIAEDDDTYSPSPQPAPLDKRHVSAVFQPEGVKAPLQERMLFIGWRRDMDDMINQLDYCVSPGSRLTLFSNLSIHEREVLYCNSRTQLLFSSVFMIYFFCSVDRRV